MNKNFYTLLRALADTVKSIQPNVYELNITFHQMGSIANEHAHGNNSPEGIHKDGTDYSYGTATGINAVTSNLLAEFPSVEVN